MEEPEILAIYSPMVLGAHMNILHSSWSIVQQVVSSECMDKPSSTCTAVERNIIEKIRNFTIGFNGKIIIEILFLVSMAIGVFRLLCQWKIYVKIIIAFSSQI